MYVWYVWTGQDYLKAGFNNIIIPIVCLKLLRLILRENGVLEDIYIL